MKVSPVKRTGHFFRFMDSTSPYFVGFLVLILTMGLGMTAIELHAENAPLEQHLEITGAHHLRLTYDFTVVWPPGGGYSATFHLPIPPDTDTQHIEHFSSTLKGQIETDSAIPPHRVLTATLRHNKGDDRDLHWRVEITGLFTIRQLVDGPVAPSKDSIAAPPADEFLASTESINWNSDAFQTWLDSAGLRRAPNETPSQYGARVFTYFKAKGEYSYPPDSAWNAAAVCRHLHSDCGGFSIVFVAACRANKIPARLLVGQWFKTRELADGTLDQTGRQSHVIAEFFDPKIGWIPEDISSTLLKVPGHSDANFFGRDPGYFFAWHIDTDFHFAVPQKADEHVQWIQNPSLWFSKNAKDASDSISHHWKLETLD
jgi:transglutaminase-like putative cysteine protease